MLSTGGVDVTVAHSTDAQVFEIDPFYQRPWYVLDDLVVFVGNSTTLLHCINNYSTLQSTN
jgi:hypothetical protein